MAPTWSLVTRSEDLPAGAIAAVGPDDELVVWRTAAGEAVVCDARCPHQWSHLEGEGTVEGDELVCTAHFWRFDTTGHGTKLNVKGRRDDKADLTVYPCREVGGVIEVLR